MMGPNLECLCDLCKTGHGGLTFIGYEPFFVCKNCSILIRREWAKRQSKKSVAA